MFEAAGSPARLCVLLVLLREARPMTVSELAYTAKKTRPHVSQQLRILRGALLVRGTRHGRCVLYELADAHAARMVRAAIDHAGHAGDDTRGKR